MFSVIAASADNGIWSSTVGLLFTWVVLLPAIVTGLIVVAMVSGRGEKRVDDELSSKWGRKPPHSG